VKRPVYGISCHTEILLGKRFQAKHLTLDAFFRKKADNYSENEQQAALSSSTLSESSHIIHILLGILNKSISVTLLHLSDLKKREIVRGLWNGLIWLRTETKGRPL
jgi:hypothetical protein